MGLACTTNEPEVLAPPPLSGVTMADGFYVQNGRLYDARRLGRAPRDLGANTRRASVAAYRGVTISLLDKASGRELVRTRVLGQWAVNWRTIWEIRRALR